jgi:transposase
MPPVPYFNMINAKDVGFRYGVRKKMVLDALEQGIKPVARAYGATVKTVRKWVKRYRAQGLPGLEERSHAPHRIPHKTPAEKEEEVLSLKKRVKGIGVRRMVKEFELGCGKEAARRILNEAGLIKKRKKKRQRRNDLRAIKAQWRVGEVSCVDTKHLIDIPFYWAQMKALHLPEWQYTYREVRSGLQFLGFADTLSLQHATVFAEWIVAWLEEHGVKKTQEEIVQELLAQDRWQTDGGSEFIGSWCAKAKSAFIRTLEARGIDHFQIPKTTYNADVETVHNLIELEFYEIETFRDRQDFFLKASTYQRWFNILRKNEYKWGKSPLDIIREAAPQVSPAVTTLPALDLDDLVRRKIAHLVKSASPPPGGYHQPGLAPPSPPRA